MAEKISFTVLRRHEGDRLYEEGETREAAAHDVGHLVASGVLEKADPKSANKAEPVHSNKTEQINHQKSGRKDAAAKAKG